MGIEITGEYAEKSWRYVTYRCDVCGYCGSMRKSHYKNGVGCSVCAGKRVLPGFNDIATARPNLVKYIIPPSDAKAYTPSSHKKVKVRCDVCGYEIQKAVSVLSKNGFRCPVCYGGNSYPNRFMAAVLFHFGINFEKEKTFSWSKRYRYDFFLNEYNTIVEMNGSQHYELKVGWGSIDDIIRSDNEKFQLAKENSINRYYIVPLLETNAQSVKDAIIRSKIFDTLSIVPNKEDWREIYRLSEIGVAKECLDLWNSGVHSITAISEIIKICTSSVAKYLKQYAEIGMCDYSAEEQRLFGLSYARKARKRKVVCVETGEVFDSLNDAAQFAGVIGNAIQNCAAGRCKHAGKDADGNRLTWKYYN